MSPASALKLLRDCLLSVCFFAFSCGEIPDDVTGVFVPETDFEGDVTQFNEACRDSILFICSGDIHRVHRDGGPAARIATKWSPGGAVWSPRKWKIFYWADTSYGKPARAIFIINAGGGGEQRISQPSENVCGVACAPDGKSIAYIVLNETGQGKIRVTDPDGRNGRDATGFIRSNGSSPTLTWSRDSRWIAFDDYQYASPSGTRSTIGRVRADGSSIDTLFANPDNMQCVGPNWSHDGRKVAYAKFAWIVDGYYLNIFYHEFATGKDYQITWQKGEARTPAWSPDDKRVLFSARPDFSSPSKLYWMNVDGSAQTVLAASPRHCWYPDW